MNSKDIREQYLAFFKERGHTIIPSASLIPEGDSTLLFVNSGMFPLVPYLKGKPHPEGTRLADSQKSFRAEDIDEVGDNRHNTFFEMLGNWSLGDYFKEEQLNWWYEFIIEALQLDPKRLYQTAFAGDERAPKDKESAEIVKQIFQKYGIEAEEGPATLGKGEEGPGEELDFTKQRIFAYRDKNWWQRGEAVGELGGPDSETFFDTGKSHNERFGKYCHLNCDCGRFLEVGNSVFMQYQKTAEGWQELAQKNVDFGGGLERLTMVAQEKDNIFETDLFSRIIEKIEEISGKKYREHMRPFEIIADHLKGAVFIMADDRGIAPSNTDQGYIVRRLIRRAIRFGKQLGIEKSQWTSEILETVIKTYQGVYPELERNQDFTRRHLQEESEKFERTLERGLKEFQEYVEQAKNSGTLSGSLAFYLYQTFGFPKEMMEELAAERGITFDETGFERETRQHQEVSRVGQERKFGGHGLVLDTGELKAATHEEAQIVTRLHTATHLLQAALRKVLGTHVKQAGSDITAERLRFDFTFDRKLTAEELSQVEALVNQTIEQDLRMEFTEMPYKEAIETGALYFEKEAYPDIVKVYKAYNPATGEVFSQELCGGPHVTHTGELGAFTILKEESVAAGIRRIRAIVL